MTEQQVSNILVSMRDSVTIINSLIVNETLSENIKKLVTTHVRHLELLMGKDFIINLVENGQDLSDITDAITAGNAKLA